MGCQQPWWSIFRKFSPQDGKICNFYNRYKFLIGLKMFLVIFFIIVIILRILIYGRFSGQKEAGPLADQNVGWGLRYTFLDFFVIFIQFVLGKIEKENAIYNDRDTLGRYAYWFTRRIFGWESCMEKHI